MDMRFKLTDPQILEIKRLLWEGAKQSEIAFIYNVTAVTISRIKQGTQPPDIIWPDGSRGPLPPERVQQLKDRRPKTFQQMVAEPEQSEPFAEQTPAAQPPVFVQTPEAHDIPQTPSPITVQEEPSWKDQIEEKADSAIEQMENELIMSMAHKHEPDKSDPPKKPDKVYYEKVEWENVLKECPKNPLVAYATNDEVFREAVCIVFKSFQDEDRNTSMCIDLCKQISKEILKHDVDHVEFDM